jgi:hypothetical protein
MRTKLLGALVAIFLVGVAWAGKGKLDGKSFKVTVTEPSKKTYDETLTFKNGQFDADGCAKYGFKPAAYAGDAASFTATAKSEKEGTIEWSGTIKGEAIEGKFVWTKTGQPTYTYSFSGAARK